VRLEVVESAVFVTVSRPPGILVAAETVAHGVALAVLEEMLMPGPSRTGLVVALAVERSLETAT
jgi:hypothetical protein